MDFIKNIDIFGHQVKIKVDNENRTHKTYYGAFATIIYFVFMCLIFYICLDA